MARRKKKHSSTAWQGLIEHVPSFTVDLQKTAGTLDSKKIGAMCLNQRVQQLQRNQIQDTRVRFRSSHRANRRLERGKQETDATNRVLTATSEFSRLRTQFLKNGYELHFVCAVIEPDHTDTARTFVHRALPSCCQNSPTNSRSFTDWLTTGRVLI